jgi:hypothetical protein
MAANSVYLGFVQGTGTSLGKSRARCSEMAAKRSTARAEPAAPRRPSSYTIYP